MGQFTVQNLTTAGLNASFTACSSGLTDEFVNDGHTLLIIVNSAAATNLVTIASQVSPVPTGLAVLNVTVNVTANATRMIGFMDQAAYNNSSGHCVLTYATHTSLSIAAISVT